jgi:thiol-disulfide isomerase/thioredoxin
MAVSAAVVLMASVIGVTWRARNGRFRTPAAPTTEPALESLGVTPGVVTLLQFSTAFCAPCRSTRAFCAEVAKTVPGVRHLEIDAESHLDEVRALDVWRTPTVLVINAEGQIRNRASGATNRAQLLAAVADVVKADVVKADLARPVAA